MVQRAGRLGLLDEAGLALRVGDLLGRQHLDGHEAVQVGVAGFIDDAHAAFAELLGDLVVQDGAADHADACRSSGKLSLESKSRKRGSDPI